MIHHYKQIAVLFLIISFISIKSHAQCTGCTNTIGTNSAITFTSNSDLICLTTASFTSNVNFNNTTGTLCVASNVNWSGGTVTTSGTINLWGTSSVDLSTNRGRIGTGATFNIKNTGSFTGALTLTSTGQVNVDGYLNPSAITLSGGSLNISTVTGVAVLRTNSINTQINNLNSLTIISTTTSLNFNTAQTLSGNISINGNVILNSPMTITGNVYVTGDFTNNNTILYVIGSLSVSGTFYNGQGSGGGATTSIAGIINTINASNNKSTFIGAGNGSSCALLCSDSLIDNTPQGKILSGVGLTLCSGTIQGGANAPGAGVVVQNETAFTPATNLTLTITTTGTRGSFTVSPNAPGYLVVRKEGSTSNVVSDTTYFVGQVLIDGSIVTNTLSSGTISSFLDTQPITCGSVYYYSVYNANLPSTSSLTSVNCGSSYTYVFTSSSTGFALATVSPAFPNTPGAITGTTSLSCTATTTSYSITTISGVNGYTWGYSGTGFIIGTTTITGGKALVNVTTSSTITAGSISVAGVNFCGTGIPSSLTISISGATSILTQPSSATICGGNSNIFTVSATGSSLTYLWSNGAVTQNITVSGAGNYNVTVSGICGNSISNTVSLSTLSGPNILVQPSSTTICGSATAYFTISASGSNLIYSWQLSTNSGTTWSTLSNGGIYNGVSNTTLTLSGLSSVNSGHQFRTIVSNGCASAVTSSGVNLIVNSGQWLGTTNTDWSNASNWCGQPTLTTDIATINSSATFMPIITSTSVNIGSITIGSSASLTLLGSNTMTLSGNFINSGTFTPNTGKVKFSGTSAQIISGSGVNLFHDLDINNTSSVTLGNTISVSGTMTLGTNGQYSSGSVTTVFLSTSSATARLAALPTGATFSGNITMQRYIPEKPTLRLMSSAVNGSTLNDWKSTIPITGIGGAANGFDASSANINTVWYFNEAINAPPTYRYVGAPNINMALSRGAGYKVFVRGDRNSVNLFGAYTVTSVVMSVSNPPNTGTINLPVTYTINNASFRDGTNLVGNPYPCEIDWDAAGWTKTNIDNALYMWDPNLGTNGQYYYYVNGVASPARTNPSVIASSQGFFVKANSTAPGLQLTEAVKTSAVHTSNFRNSNFKTSEVLRIQLKDTSTSSFDETVVRFVDQATQAFDKDYDAYKLYNSTLNISSNPVAGTDLSINAMGTDATNITLPLSVYSTKKGKHSIQISGVDNFTEGFSVYLKDSYLHTLSEMNNSSPYHFNISKDVKSSGPERFSLIVYRSQITTGTESINTDIFPALKVYPNPNNGSGLTVDFYNFKEINLDLTVTDVSGRVLIQKNLQMDNLPYYQAELSDFGGLSSGVYFVNIYSSKAKFTERVILVK